MDPPSQGPPYSSVRQQLFHSAHLPPPSQLHLPPVNASRSNVNTLPPLNSSSSRVSSYNHRHASPPSSSWSATIHRTSNSRDDTLPAQGSLHHSPNMHSYNQPGPRPVESRQLKREQPPPPAPPPQAPTKEMDDNMPATCDFVKKLYKYVSSVRYILSSHHRSVVPGCLRIRPFPISSRGVRMAIALSSRYVPCTHRARSERGDARSAAGI